MDIREVIREHEDSLHEQCISLALDLEKNLQQLEKPGYKRKWSREKEVEVNLIHPILRTLGWDPRETDDYSIEVQYTVERSRPDFILLHRRKPVFAVEAKGLGKIKLDRNLHKQLWRFFHTCEFIVLTDGFLWFLFDRKAFPTPRWFIDIREDDLNYCSNLLVALSSTLTKITPYQAIDYGMNRAEFYETDLVLRKLDSLMGNWNPLQYIIEAMSMKIYPMFTDEKHKVSRTKIQEIIRNYYGGDILDELTTFIKLEHEE